MKTDIHSIYSDCKLIAARDKTTKEQLFHGVQALYIESCNVLGKKPMTARQWQRKVRRLQKFGLPQQEKVTLDELYAITTTVSTFDDSTNADVLGGILKMYQLTLKKIK